MPKARHFAGSLAVSVMTTQVCGLSTPAVQARITLGLTLGTTCRERADPGQLEVA